MSNQKSAASAWAEAALLLKPLASIEGILDIHGRNSKHGEAFVCCRAPALEFRVLKDVVRALTGNTAWWNSELLPWEGLVPDGTDCVHLCAGSGDGIPGPLVDRFGPLLVATDYAEATASNGAEDLLRVMRESFPGVEDPTYAEPTVLAGVRLGKAR
jgi:hypothetical protein